MKKTKHNKKRLFTFFRGPVTDPLPILQHNDGQEVKELFKRSITNHGGHDKQQITPKMVANEISIGLNSVIKLTEKHKSLGIILQDPLTVHIQKCIFDLCSEVKVPLILVPSLEELHSSLGISSLCAIAFRDGVVKETAILHDLYKLFQAKATKFSSNIFESNIESGEIIKRETHDAVENKANPPKWPKVDTLIATNDQLLLPKANIEQDDIYEVNLNGLFPSINVFGDTFIAIEERNDHYFPKRNMDNPILELKITSDEMPKKRDEYFKKLIEDDEDMSSKRKRAQDSKRNKSFKGPQVVSLEASGKKKNKRKKGQNKVH